MLISVHNPRINLIRQLQQKKYRDKEKKFVVEGIHPIKEIQNLKSKIQNKSKIPNPNIEYVVYSSRLKEKNLIGKLKELDLPVYEVSDKVLDSLSRTETPQGILAVVKKLKYKLEDILSQDALIMVCIDIQDPGNLGTIIRTTDAVGGSGVILAGNCVDLYNDKVIRATQGSIFHLPVVEGKAQEIVNDLKSRRRGIASSVLKIVGTSLNAKKDYREVVYTRPVAVMVGNESHGIPDDILALADEQVKIPIYGKAESLNAAVAAGILLYEVVRQGK